MVCSSAELRHGRLNRLRNAVLTFGALQVLLQDLPRGIFDELARR